ncbi:MAG: helix-turn-helix domain-containing protein [Haloferacaceae archaeon]
MSAPAENAEGGIRAELRVETGACPVAAVSAEADSAVGSVSWSSPSSDGTVVEEFTVDRDGTDVPTGEPVYVTDDTATYRFERTDEGCVCAGIESIGVPVSSVRARDGALTLTLYVEEVARIREIVATLRDRYDGVSIRRLSRSGDATDRELVVVDRSRLTDRQLEVLETAHEMGYFAHPKGANASEVADELDVAPATLAEHLSAAQSKILDAILAD